MLSCLSLLTFTHGVEVSVFGPSVSSVAGILFCSSMLAVRVAVRALPSEYEAVRFFGRCLCGATAVITLASVGILEANEALLSAFTVRPLPPLTLPAPPSLSHP